VIELTEEMERAMYAALNVAEPGRHHAAVRTGLAAVLIIADRDRELQISQAYVRGWEEATAKAAAGAAELITAARAREPRRCSDCGRSARELTATQDADGSVIHLGPGCARRRLQRTLQRAEALPIGGDQ